MGNYGKIIENAKKLERWHIRPEGMTAGAVTETRDALLQLLLAYARETHPEWAVDENKVMAGGRPRVQTCQEKARLASNQAGMLTGCLNRMSITDNEKEFHNLSESAAHRIRVLAGLCLERLGQDAIDWFEWTCPLNTKSSKGKQTTNRR